MTKKYLICGKCETESKTTVFKWVGQGFGVEVRRIPFILGEITDSGDVIIKRSQHGYTKVSGDNFSVVCERCGEAAYRKEVLDGTINKISGQWQSRSLGGTISGAFGTI